MTLMLTKYLNHNRFKEGIGSFSKTDPHLFALSELKYQHSSDWWREIHFSVPGIYILTGGRQIGKSTSCKLLIKYCLEKRIFTPSQILYLPCDEIFDAKDLGEILRYFFHTLELEDNKHFLLIIDEITYVKDWDRVIKALADEGYFKQGICLLTGSDTLILKEAAMRFPGRRGKSDKTDFHLYPLSFFDYVKLRLPNSEPNALQLEKYFKEYLICGGYLRAINDYAELGAISQATYLTYEQWIRGDLLRQRKSEATLLMLLQALLTIGVSPISYSSLTQKIGQISKDTCIDYCQILERLDILIALQAFDQNKKQGFPKKDKKFHFTDPFILRTFEHWLQREKYFSLNVPESLIVEACVASHCHRFGSTFYFKGQGEIDIIWQHENKIEAIEVKWANQLRPNDLKTLKLFQNSLILTKNTHEGYIEHINCLPVYQFLYDLKYPGAIK